MRTRHNSIAVRRWLCQLAAWGCALNPIDMRAAAPVAQAKEPDFTLMSLEDLGAIKVPTVLGASKHQQKVTEAPSAVSIVTADEIKKQGHRTLGEILQGVRGFYVTSDRGYNSIGVRGVNRPGDYGGRLLITVNGQRINDPIYDTAASGMDFILDVDLIERVEVIRGPGSSLYGNNAFFGVINVITRKGREVRGTELSGSAATFDTYTGRVTYGNTFTNGVELMLSGTLYDSAGNPRLRYPEFSSINQGVAENMDDGRARSAFGSISWHGVSLEAGMVDRRKTWPTAPYASEGAVVIFNDPHFFTRDVRSFANLKYEHTFENGWEIMGRAYYDHYRFDAQYPYDYMDPLQPVYLNQDFGYSDSLGLETQVSKRFFEKHRATAGLEFRSDFRLDQGNYDARPRETYLDSRETGNFYSFYVQDEFQVRTNLILNAGVRYDHFSSFGDTVNPRAAVIYQPWEPTTIKFLYGQAFRAPNAYEKFYETFNYKRNSELGPETIRSYELVLEQKLNAHWSASASFFLNEIKNLIGLQQDPADDFYYFDNVDAVQARGAELEVAAQWANGLQGHASYTYTHTEDSRTGARLSNSPEHVGKLGLSVPLWREKIFASMELQGMSERDTVRAGSVDAVWLVNATLYSRELAKGLELSASVFNLFDQRYRDPVADDFTQDSIPQEGRTFRLKLTYKF